LVRLAHAWSSLERTGVIKFWAAYKVARLSEGDVRLSEGDVRLSEASSGSSQTHELSNPISSKNPNLIPNHPK